MWKAILLNVMVACVFFSGCAVNSQLGIAAYKGDIDRVQELLNQGADVNERTFGGTMPLMNAAAGGNLEIVKILVDKGADVNALSEPALGLTPLRYAALFGHRDVIAFLVEHGADIDRAIIAMKRATNEFARKDNQIAMDYLQEYKDALAGTSGPVARSVESKRTVPSDIDDPPAIKIATTQKHYAIVIGIEQYRQQLPRADFAAADARTVTRYLTKTMGYPEENVVTLLNDRATNVDLVKYFEKWLPNNVEKDSTVFVYFSGHGAPNPKTGDAYLVPYDGDPSFIEETGYSLNRMYDALGKLPAKEIVVALDSCFSGAGGRSVLAKGARPLVMNLQTGAALSKNMTVLAASSGDQISSTYDEKGHGLFTYFLLKGIRDGNGVNPDGSIQVDALFDYVKPQVERIARKQYNNEQTPRLITPEK